MRFKNKLKQTINYESPLSVFYQSPVLIYDNCSTDKKGNYSCIDTNSVYDSSSPFLS